MYLGILWSVSRETTGKEEPGITVELKKERAG